ncbi:hypothetical protein [Actinomycetospora atypica]|uniref:Uncharacterized protein n=1 Tax=Actinomycetospora atypica TaxID=1290095 RepID=A0ABV9YN39_9PSEU
MSSYRESATPIFDEVDRRWRKVDDTDETDAGDPEGTPSMLSFSGAHRAPAAPPRRETGPRHALRR